MAFDWLARNRAETGQTVREIADRVIAERQALREHEEQSLSIEEAHKTMQEHRLCSVADCYRKFAAQAVLIRAGRMVPDPRRSY